ncbi:LppX_LprAFG lipoprotein [Nocardioides ferulae]|uniref:LppX_LprAFG lipoprotein n=1 Tax=Nocardioides ferulae TaxID=2340821 RepID=UPI000EB175DE|nr:LppX_LprAFG lipoprotein [Nocardioides ferulae]
MVRPLARPTRARRTAAAVLVPLSLAALTACGDDEGSAASSGNVALESQVEEVAEGETVDAADVGEQMLASFTEGETVSVEMTMTLMGAEMVSEGVGSYAGDQPETAMTMTNPFLGEDETEVRFVDGVVYMNLGALSDNKFWSLDPSDADGSGLPLGGTLDQMADPRAALESMSEAVTEAVYAGEEEVDGETTDRYTLTIDVEEMFAASGLGELGADATAMMPAEVTQDIWFGEDGLVRKAAVDMGDAGSTVMEFSGWGEPVTIEAPPADQVEEMPDLDQLGQMGGQVAG